MRPCNVKSTSCIDLSVSEPGPRLPARPRILLKAPTLAEMEEMNISEVSSSAEILEFFGNDWSYLSVLAQQHVSSCLTASVGSASSVGSKVNRGGKSNFPQVQLI